MPGGKQVFFKNHTIVVPINTTGKPHINCREYREFFIKIAKHFKPGQANSPKLPRQ